MPPHGKFIWNELMTHDIERTKKFYGGTLGWSFEPMQMPDMTYWIIKMGDERVGGMYEMKGSDFADMPEQWVSYVGVDNVDARYKKALAAGAKKMREPFDVPNVGRIGFLVDPGGAVIAWMTPAM